MKEKIDRLSKGIFQYDSPKVVVSGESIELIIGAGTNLQSSFTVSNSESGAMKGILYSNHIHFRLLEDTFIGQENIIHYEVQGEHYESGDIIEGEVTIVSDCSEVSLPFVVRIEAPSCITSIGKIRDLYHFANLAKKDWIEAVKLFRSEDFVNVFLPSDVKNQLIYQSLSKNVSTSQALEEFLVTMKKKTPIHLTISQNHYKFLQVTEKFMDKVILTKDNWGYLEIKVTSNADFLVPERGRIWADNFIGNNYKLEFVLNTERMREGMNYGQIQLKTIYQTIHVDVVCCYNREHPITESKYYKEQRMNAAILKTYIEFRQHKLTAEEYTRETNDLLIGLSEEAGDRYELLKTHINMVMKNADKVKQKLEYFEGKKEELKSSSIVDYCGFLYLNALYTKENTVIKNAVAEIHGYYSGGCDELELLWFLLYLDTKYETNRSLRLLELKKQFVKGCHSPVLYYETMDLYNEEPVLIHELTAFEIQVLHWGVEQDCLSKETAARYTYLAGHQKSFKAIIYRDLTVLYEKYQSKDLLTAICSMLIKAQKTSNQYFSWYRLGVEAQLKITQLHEYYMYALNEEDNITLPQPILLYFVYNSTLSDNKKSYLYAQIIKNKESNASVYENYIKNIRLFAEKQLRNRNISQNLAVIYRDVLTIDPLDEESALHLPYLMFRYQVKCSNSNIKGVIVLHRELENETYVPFVNKEAQISIYTDHAEIFLVDFKDNRYVTTVDYTLNRFLQMEEYVNPCMELCPDHPILLLHMGANAENVATPHMNRKILESENLSDFSRQSMLQRVVQYYSYSYEGAAEGEVLDYYLLQIHLDYLKRKERNQMIEYYIDRGHYAEAFDSIKEYGYEGIETSKLKKLAMKQVIPLKNEENRILLQLCAYLIRGGCKNGVLAEYMLLHYTGPTKIMFDIWQLSHALHLYSSDYEERLLVQILFTEDSVVEAAEVFERFAAEHKNRKLTRAFLTFSAHQYFFYDRIIKTELFDQIRQDALYEENEVCLLALLKHCCYKTELGEDELKFIDLRIQDFFRKGIILPFFSLFGERIHLPERLRNRYYVEYKASPSKKIYIHYSLNDGSGQKETITELLPNMIEGIRVKEFILFYNESLEYFISEEDTSGRETISETFQIKPANLGKSSVNSSYQQLNQMLELYEQNEDEALLAMFEDSVKADFIVDEVFKAL